MSRHKFKIDHVFTVNTAFVNYLDKLPNLIESLEFQIIRNKTTFEQTLPITLNVSKFNPTLLTTSRDLKDFINSYINHKEIFDLQERHDGTEVKLNTNKNFFSDNYIVHIFLFITVIVSLLATTLTVYLLCKHKKLQTLIASLVLHQVKEVGTVMQKEINSECKTLTYISLVLTILGLVMVASLHYTKYKFCRGCTFSNAVKIMIFISDVQDYICIKLCKTAGSIHLFKITGRLKPENIQVNKNYIWDTLEIDWKEVTVTFNDNKISLPRVVTIKLQDKIKLRCLMKREPLLLHLMLKQGITWFTMATGTQETL